MVPPPHAASVEWVGGPGEERPPLPPDQPIKGVA